MKFNLVVADCPWQASDKLSMSKIARGADANYDTMSTEDLCNLPVKNLADPNGCVLCLWVLGSMLEDGMKVMKSWGFSQRQVYVWAKSKKQSSLDDIFKKDFISIAKKVKNDPVSAIKDLSKITFKLGENILSFGMGRLFRSSHEICLIGINNTGIYKKLKNKSQRSVCFDENKGHSNKPEALQDSLDKMFEGNKVELFARRQRPGWICKGNECPGSEGEDIKVSIQKLIDM